MEQPLWYQYVVQIALAIVGIVEGFGLVPIVEWLKTVFKASGNKAITLSVIVAIVLGLITVVAQELIDPTTVTPESVGILILAIFATAKARYEELKRKRQV